MEDMKLFFFSGWINAKIIKIHGPDWSVMWQKAAEKAAYNGRELVVFEIPKQDGHIITPLVYEIEKMLSERVPKEVLTVGNMFEKL